MEAQNFPSGVCPKLSFPSIWHVKESFFLKLPPLPLPSSCSFVQSQKLASREACNSITYKVSSRKRIQCSSNVGVVTTEGDSKRAPVRRKKLAVFVSGGGSNFRSIHEASLQGSVHGDVTVLVTNKSGMRCFNPYSSAEYCGICAFLDY